MSDQNNNDLSGIDKYSGSYDQDELGVTQIPTDTIRLLNDFTLLGLFTFLASCSSDWKLNAKHLARHFDCNKDKIYKAIDSLIELGLLTRTQVRNNGKFLRYHYRLHLRQKVQTLPSPEKPDTVKPDTVNPDAYKTNILPLENIKIMCGDSSNPSAHTPKSFKETKKAQTEKSALEDSEIKAFFDKKFGSFNVTLEELFQKCQQHYEQKGLWVTRDKLMKWIKDEYPENYIKKKFMSSSNDPTRPTQIDFCEYRAKVKGYEWVGEWLEKNNAKLG